MNRKIIAELLRPSLLAACPALICLVFGCARTEAPSQNIVAKAKRLAASVDKREGGMALSSALQWRWGDAEAVLDYWADKLTRRLAELKGEPKAG